jgi:hypothetical protein
VHETSNWTADAMARRTVQSHVNCTAPEVLRTQIWDISSTHNTNCRTRISGLLCNSKLKEGARERATKKNEEKKRRSEQK